MGDQHPRTSKDAASDKNFMSAALRRRRGRNEKNPLDLEHVDVLLDFAWLGPAARQDCPCGLPQA